MYHLSILMFKTHVWEPEPVWTDDTIFVPISRLTELHGITEHSEISLTLVVSCSVDQRDHEKEESGWN